MLSSAPSGPSLSVSPLVKLSVVGRGGAGNGGSCVMIPDLVVMAKAGASGLGVSLLLIVESIWECHHSDRTSEGKDHCRCLLRTSIPAQMGCSVHIHQPHRILRSNRKSGCIASVMEETFMDGDGSSHISYWYWTYSSIRFYPSSSVRESKQNWMNWSSFLWSSWDMLS
ncbi:hypothetical protein Tco_0315729 [Tanacetum coccineum]